MPIVFFSKDNDFFIDHCGVGTLKTGKLLKKSGDVRVYL